MRLALTALAALVPATSASAEVCDKAMGEAWTRGDGPQLLFGFGTAGSAIVLAVAIAAIAFRIVPPILILWAGLIEAVFAGLALLEHYDLSDESVFRGLLSEGCRAIWADAAGLMFGFAVIVSALVRRRNSKSWTSLD